jgi:uncharacterized protein YndB with AHSA1/START domain
MNEGSNASSPNQIRITRKIAAAPDLVFKCWADASIIDAWFGPIGFANQTISMDFREGGHWSYNMVGPDGVVYPNYVSYKEIVTPRKIAYEHGSFEGDPNSFDTVITFEYEHGETTVTLLAQLRSDAAYQEALAIGAVEGGEGTLSRLAHKVQLLGEQWELRITKVLNAPRQLVFDAFTKAEHLAQWWGPSGSEIKVESLELSAGGHFHYFLDTPNGKMYGRFDYFEVSPIDSLGFYSGFADESGQITKAPFPIAFPLQVANIYQFIDGGETTTLHMRGIPSMNSTKEEFDTFISMRDNMNAGFEGSFQNLIAYIAKIK